MIIRKEFVKAAVGYSAEAPQIDADGKLIPTKGVYDLLCDEVSDLLADGGLAVGSMAYVRSVAEHRQVKVADAGEASDWEAVNTNTADDTDGDQEPAEDEA